MLAPLDWLLVGLYFAFSTGVAMYYYRRAGQDTDEFFLTGRNMPWWLAGTSMVATTFAADTPLLVTEIVAQNGVAGNWLWWNAALGGMLTTFFFARLWRRSGVLTDVEFVELRYSGKAAGWLRGLKAVYFGLLMNALIVGWVALAMETVLVVLFPDLQLFGRESFSFLGAEVSAALALVALLVLVVALYSLLSGLWGVMVTDVFQFVVAMTGSIALAVFALGQPEVGGLAGLRAQLPASTFDLLPTLGEAGAAAGTLALSGAAFAAFVGVQWWASWYPGAEPGGGGYVAQRMMSAKDEQHALFATLWFTVAHYCVRPWPWILTALVSLVMFPGLENTREGFVRVMVEVLPTGWLGLMVAAFLAAFMSTISTQLNWGSSYLVNDLWRRFIRPGASEKHYVAVSRIVTLLIALAAIAVTAQLETIAEAWGLALTASAGLGGVLILRWYWWRVNAWSELAATIAPIVLTLVALFVAPLAEFLGAFPTNLFAVTAFTTVVWLAATFVTRPTEAATLDHFYHRVRPAGRGWRPLARQHPEVDPAVSLPRLLGDWAVGVALVYATLFAVGALVLGEVVRGLVLLAVAVVCGAFLWYDLAAQQREERAAAQA